MSTPTGTGPLGPLAPPAPPPAAGGGPLVVDPAVLEAEGKVLQEVGSAIPGEALRLYGPSDNAVTQLHGWRVAAALETCTQAWVDRLKKFGVGLDQNGAKLVASATNYSTTNSSAAQSFQNLLGGPGFGYRAGA
ncbi:hypothetical protein [Streptacidiphilus jiangxiensis]|uniref:Excreted virulence factor EspC, type VII ESX diderm n=1 Tax=Streptacidiphilus jiangxiensis TaxID=235985 RepID=A0A1H7RGQ8_STRJI|nr:hypothetical protein [Streptacidiphilus jiangxiensis]SEL58507.1 hypothetical protein SAMN05414137_11082 [Streptacidiphilus jiangxiensis]